MPAQRRAPRLSRFYSRIAANGWRDSEYFTFSVRSVALRRWIAAELPAGRKKILSIGCGTGEMERHVAELGYQVTGLDTSRPMLKRARERGLAAVVQADAQALPFAADSVDVVLYMECIGYLQLPQAFAEARRVLKKRGRLLLTTYAGDVKVHGPYLKFGLGEITAALVAAGFRPAAHRFLNARRGAVTEVGAEDGSTLLYLCATKPATA